MTGTITEIIMATVLMTSPTAGIKTNTETPQLISSTDISYNLELKTPNNALNLQDTFQPAILQEDKKTYHIIRLQRTPVNGTVPEYKTQTHLGLGHMPGKGHRTNKYSGRRLK